MFQQRNNIFIVRFFILFILILGFSRNIIAKPLIVTSTNQYGSLVSMIGGDNVNVEVLLKSTSCPHHLVLKPSQIDMIKNADIVLYTDDNFETALSEIKGSITGKLIKITNIENIDFHDNNFHVWLNIENAKLIIKTLKSNLQEIGVNSEVLEDNFKVAISELDNLKISWEKFFNSTKDKIVIVSDSLEYLPIKTDKIIPKFIKSGSSLKHISEVSSEIKRINPSCILASSSMKKERVYNVVGNRKTIFLNCENFANDKIALRDLYVSEMYNFLNFIMEECCGNKECKE